MRQALSGRPSGRRGRRVIAPVRVRHACRVLSDVALTVTWMDLDYYAWRRFSRAWPLAALIALLLIPGVWEWVTQMHVGRALRVFEWSYALFTEVVLQPMVESIQDNFVPSQTPPTPIQPAPVR